jgi:processive 1,2-diacylglycerol beta-glucosyltransferase
MGKTLAVFSVSAGAGHMRAAEAIVAAAERDVPGTKAVHLDLMTVVGDVFRKMYAESYVSLVDHHPSVWGYLYRKADRSSADSMMHRLRRLVEKLNTRGFFDRLAEINPDLVVCTHFLPAELLSRRIGHGRFDKPVYVQVTDFDIHAMWLHEHMTGYFAATDEVAFRMAERGILADRIEVTGIPIMPVFATPPTRAEAARELGLDPTRLTLLMMSGGFGVGGIDALAERLLGIPGDFQLVALAGRNEELKKKLEALAGAHPGRLFSDGVHPHDRAGHGLRRRGDHQAGRPDDLGVSGHGHSHADHFSDSRAGGTQRRLSARAGGGPEGV